MRSIPATQGFTILCDDEDYERLSGFRWYAHNCSNNSGKHKRPATRASKANAEGKRPVTFFHHAVIGEARKGMVIDHINGDVWDNRRANLRVCTNAENLRNQRRVRKDNGCGKGVHRINGKLAVIITKDRKTHRIFGCKTIRQAELTYDALALHLHGEFACLNHPHNPTRAKSPEQVRQELAADRPSGRVVPYLRAGLRATEAARLAGCSISTACQTAKALGIDLRRGRPSMDRAA